MPKNIVPILHQNADAAEAVRWVRILTHWIGPGFHPDTAAGEYVDVATGTPTFGMETTVRLDRDLQRAESLLEERGRSVYDIAIKVQRRALRPRSVS